MRFFRTRTLVKRHSLLLTEFYLKYPRSSWKADRANRLKVTASLFMSLNITRYVVVRTTYIIESQADRRKSSCRKKLRQRGNQGSNRSSLPTATLWLATEIITKLVFNYFNSKDYSWCSSLKGKFLAHTTVRDP